MQGPERIAEHLEALLIRVEVLRPTLLLLQQKLATLKPSTFDKHSQDHWALFLYSSAIQRLLTFQGANFTYIETLGLLALTRYVFELKLWVLQVSRDRRYSLVYYDQQLQTMANYYQDQVTHFADEAAFFDTIHQRETTDFTSKIREVMQLEDQARLSALKAMPGELMESVDREAALRFAVHLEEAVTNGYGFQAHQIQTNEIPAAQKCVRDLIAERDELHAAVTSDIRALMPRRWNWRDVARRVGIDSEYGYIYSYTSKLLHATPASITTNQHNLEPFEVRIFLRYIVVSLRQICSAIESDV